MRIRLLAIGLSVAVGAGAALAQTTPTPPAATTAPAVSPCTDLPEPDCGTVAGCVWLPGYKVASGATVMGYCRPAPKPLTARRGPGLPTPPQQ